jgi:UDP:flavonoid glycosyltransferase YjiC (YdhE family)
MEQTPGKNSAVKGRTILFALLPEQSAYNASFALSRSLKERGFRVVYLCPAPFKEYLLRQGHEVFFPEQNAAAGALKGLRRVREQVRLRAHNYVQSLGSIRAWIEANSPALVLLDPVLWPSSPPFLDLEVPVMGFNITLASVFQAGLPPVFSSYIPREKGGWFESLQYSLAWLGLLLPHYRDRWLENLKMFLVFGPRKWREYRAHELIQRSGGKLRCGEYGFRLQVPELVPAPREFDFPRVSTWTRRFYLGAGVDRDRRDASLDWRNIRKDKFLIYCSLGTYSQDYRRARQLFDSLIEAVKSQADWQAVVQVGKGIEPEEFGSLPERLLVAKWVPQLEVLEHAGLFITHGGFSSVREAIYYGVPMIVFPCRVDQPGNAARVVYHKLGERADITTVSPAVMTQLVERVRQNTEIRSSIKKMQQVFRAQESCQQVLDLLEQRLARKPE